MVNTRLSYTYIKESVILCSMIDKDRREYLIARIMESSVVRENGCREWLGTLNNGGYGMIHFAKEWGEGYDACTTAHRAHYMAYHDVVLTNDQVACHSCDNRKCVNVDHVFIGTHKDNSDDKLRKGRNAKHYKLHTRRRVFTDDQIRAIRNATGSLKSIAQDHGASMGYVSKLRAGKAKTLVYGGGESDNKPATSMS